MKTKTGLLVFAALVAAGAGSWWKLSGARAVSANAGDYSSNWNRNKTAEYLDYRETWWEGWQGAQLDHGTVCVSCHTSVPYALVRPVLQKELGQSGIPGPEKAMLDDVEKRVSQWEEMSSYYSGPVNGPGSRATEAVLNALILASQDASMGHLRPITRTALDHAWKLQEQSGENAGGWKWQDFHLAPWEAPESSYQGAAWMALAVGIAPNGYKNEPQIQQPLQQLRHYLQSHYAAQPLMNQLYVLWAASRISGLITDDERAKLIERIRESQLPDGSWRLQDLDPQPGKRRAIRDEWEKLAHTAHGDGCATGLAVLALEESGVSRQDQVLAGGLAWLEHHQGKDGIWRASSMNGPVDPRSETKEFMDDAATGYAVMALEKARSNDRLGTGSEPSSGSY